MPDIPLLVQKEEDQAAIRGIPSTVCSPVSLADGDNLPLFPFSVIPGYSLFLRHFQFIPTDY